MLLFKYPINYNRTISDNKGMSKIIDNRFDTFVTSSTISFTTGGASYTHAFVIGKGIASYTLRGTTRTIPANVTDTSGETHSTTVNGLQYDLYELPAGNTSTAASFVFTGGSGFQVHQILLLDSVIEIESDINFERISYNILQSGSTTINNDIGRQRRIVGINNARDLYSVDYRLRFPRSITTGSTDYRPFLINLKNFINENKTFTCIPEYTRFPEIIMPKCSILQDTIPIEFIGQWKALGQNISFTISEHY